MPICYHKEAFAIGIVTALFIVAIIHIFGGVIGDWLKRFLKLVRGGLIPTPPQNQTNH